MVNLKQMRDLVIEPTLRQIEMHSPEASDLVLFTGLVESRYEYVRQMGSGPARSFWQVEPATLYDHFQHYINFRSDLAMAIAEIEPHPNEQTLTTNMAFAVVMCRIKYRRSPMKLPPVGDGPGMAHIWKEVYNTHEGKGREEEFLALWEEYKDELY